MLLLLYFSVQQYVVPFSLSAQEAVPSNQVYDSEMFTQ